MTHRLHLWTAGIVIAAALASPAHAAWRLASSDAPVGVVRGANVTSAAAGDTLRGGDLLESREGVAHLQDEHGTLVALGPQTRAMLMADARVALLSGWLKIAAAACATAPCAQVRVDTESGALDVGSSAAAIIAAHVNTQTVDVFSETGTQTLPTNPPTSIRSGRFASFDSTGRVQFSARPTDAFVTTMPVAFRDALQPLAVARPAHIAPPSHAATYDDIAPWLDSKLPARKSFPARFRSRLTDRAFRHDVQAHLNVLPDWRALLYPPARPGVHNVRYP
ncbi:hypothetical protein M3I53_21175 [Paraburkholderia sp. CNPSo 3272]|uniref:hypothetical protein n=1 Tax=Paraburkholderia sp. CNPSo 3272 TaxID=2940931 RepID=UPI0020B802ED|nr:hypothetical protein [Paraburkholderia sp. CNPSo 3272]MCP3725605.1 hypothetical protein [Paraburkholderia sp. CNPSo 3272]